MNSKTEDVAANPNRRDEWSVSAETVTVVAAMWDATPAR